MAEGLIGAILGGDDEKPEVEAPEGLASAEPFAAAIAARLSAGDAEVARETSAFLKQQAQLLETQNRHLEAEHPARLQYLRGQAREVEMRHFALRLRLALQIFLVLGATVLGIGALIVFRDAVTNHGLVVEAFSVPPDMAKDGLTGDVVATRFLDKLQALQAATLSDRPSDSYQYNWGSDIKVEIPETGLDLHAFSKYFRDRFGHVNRITGEVIRTAAGIAVTARFGDVPPTTFTGAEADFDELAGKAAEAVYRTSQPYRYAQFLAGHGRNDEALTVITELATNGPRGERSWAEVEWGWLEMTAYGNLQAARPHCLKGLSGASTNSAEICVIEAEVWSGHDEKALLYSRPLAISAQTKVPGTTDEFFEGNRIISVAWLETLTGEIQKSVKDWTLVEDKPFWFGTDKLASTLVASGYAVNHDPDAAAAVARTLPSDIDQSSLALDALNGFYPFPTYWIAAARNDWAAALSDARLSDAWLESHDAANKLLRPLRGVWIQPLEALALAHTGDIPGAEKLAAATPLDCYLCVRIRGQIASLKHDWPAAEAWFAEAVRQAPSLPFAYSEWGEMRLAKGDFGGAISRFEIAHKKTGQFADALKGWGDALARLGQQKAARAKYDEALKYSPNWAELKQARALAAGST